MDAAAIARSFPIPSREADASLAAQLRSLHRDRVVDARDCLVANAGTVVARNGCRGPWTQSLNIQWRPPLPSQWVARVTPNVYLQNVLAGVDQLRAWQRILRGWGSPAMPDPVLLVPRGFDASANRFRYDVNPRFADTRPGHTLFRDPFRLVIDFSLNLSTDYDLQQLRRAVEPMKGPVGWMRRVGRFARGVLSLEHVEHSQGAHRRGGFAVPQRGAGDRAAHARTRCSRRAFAPSTSRSASFSRSGEGGAGKAELDSVQTTQKAYWKIFWEQPEIADSIVNPSQRELLPMFKSMVATPMKDREHSQWQFGRPVTFADKPRVASAR